MALIRKRRLTEQQQRRIEKQHKSRQEELDTSQDLDGLVVQHYGRQLEVQALSVPAQHPEKPQVAEGEPEPFWKPIEEISKLGSRLTVQASIFKRRKKVLRITSKPLRIVHVRTCPDSVQSNNSINLEEKLHA